MGELVAFRPHSRAACGPQSQVTDSTGNPDEGAEILFFTGVRIARFEDYPEQPKGRRSEPRHRARRRERTTR
jgi:hypothetical protein